MVVSFKQDSIIADILYVPSDPYNPKHSQKKIFPSMSEIRTSGYKKRAAKRWNFKEITLLGRPPMDKLNIVLFVK